MQKWSIGIYTGTTPFEIGDSNFTKNPVIKADHVKDVSTDFIADPFMVHRDDTWYMFFEVLSDIGGQEHEDGVIGLATSIDAINWTYQRTVLKEPFHLSYPCVFEYQNEMYMVPETLGANSVRLYRATDFPTKWEHVADLLSESHADATPFFKDGHWWMFTCPTPSTHDTLNLYHSDNLFGRWRKHPASPIVANNNRTARPAGRVIQWGDRWFRFAQDCQPRYGTQVRMFEILKLDTDVYIGFQSTQVPSLN